MARVEKMGRKRQLLVGTLTDGMGWLIETVIGRC